MGMGLLCVWRRRLLLPGVWVGMVVMAVMAVAMSFLRRTTMTTTTTTTMMMMMMIRYQARAAAAMVRLGNLRARMIIRWTRITHPAVVTTVAAMTAMTTKTEMTMPATAEQTAEEPVGMTPVSMPPVPLPPTDAAKSGLATVDHHHRRRLRHLLRLA